MKLRDLHRMVGGTASAAFATGPSGDVVAWNSAAEELTGVRAASAMGRMCGDVLGGEDECGAYCRPGCAVRQAICEKRSVAPYELKVRTTRGLQWCSMSTIPAEVDGAGSVHALHLIQPIDVWKRIELAVKGLLGKPAAAVAPAQAAALTAREIEVLRLVARGNTSAAAGAQLGISKATVNNHVQQILSKLHAHTRLEAVRRAEAAGLI